MEQEQPKQLMGNVEEIVFRNEENGWTVLSLSSGDILYTVVGTMPGIEAGEELKITGEFVVHPTFGEQFRADMVERQMPATASTILKYLSSGAVKGIGPATARKLVERFGDETLLVMEKEPEKLMEIKGITRDKMEKITGEFNRIFGIRAVMIFLSQYGITPAESVLIWKKWGLETTKTIEENPYLLCGYDIGISFSRADQIAKQVEIMPSSPCRITGALSYVLSGNLNSGHTCLPYEKLVDKTNQFLNIDRDCVAVQLDEDVKEKKFIYEKVGTEEYIYLPALYRAEKYVATRLAMILDFFPNNGVSYMRQIRDLQEQKGIRYAPLQQKAISDALSQGLLILTGGPGTGKTTTVNAIITLLEREGLKVELTAPTGRAAKRLSEVTGREAKTIHRLLEGFHKADGFFFERNEENPLDADVVIVDELSMVDIQLFENLLKAMRLSCRLVLVGDHNQLPSVGAGNVLRDMIASGVLPVVELDEIFRQAAQSAIVTNAHKIVRGENPDLSQKCSDFFFMKSANYQYTHHLVSDLCAHRLPKAYQFSPLWDIQVIAPSKKGEVGTYQLNLILQHKLNPPEPGKPEFKIGANLFRSGDKVMQIRNNYDLEYTTSLGESGQGVFNGDIGVIEAIDKHSKLMRIRFEERIVQYPFELANQLELAYAVTVHKSQGSEFDAVIIPLMQSHSKLYFRNLLYTAVTRAKKILIVIGTEDTFYTMIANNRRARRFSNLEYFLKQETKQIAEE